MINVSEMEQALKDGNWLGSETVSTWAGTENDTVPADRVVESQTLRKVMLGIDPAAYPYGLMLRGLVIVGDLELSDLTIGCRIRWRRCRFTGTVAMENTRLRRLALGGCRFDKTLYADRLVVEGAVHFSGNSGGPGVEPFRAMRGIRLGGAKLGSLNLNGAYLGRDNDGHSLNADGLKIDGSAKLGSGTDCGPLTAEGTLHLAGASIGGQLNLNAANLATGASLNSIPVALEAQRLNVGGDLDGGELRTIGGIDLHGAVIGGELTLTAQVGGRLNLRDATVATLNLIDHKQPPLKSAMGISVRHVSGWAQDNHRGVAEWLASAEDRAAQPFLEFAAFYDKDGKAGKAKSLRFCAEQLATFRNRRKPRVSRLPSLLTIGYGYHPLFAIGWLIATLALTFVLVSSNASGFSTTSTVIIKVAPNSPTQTLEPGRVTDAECLAAAKQPPPNPWTVPCLSPVSYALTNSLPAMPGTAISPWAPPHWLEFILIGLRLCGWLFTVLLLAGLTGLLRKT